jgi:hypothetical protein
MILRCEARVGVRVDHPGEHPGLAPLHGDDTWTARTGQSAPTIQCNYRSGCD